MQTGTKISLAGHGVLLSLAAFGGPLFDRDQSAAIQISEVSIITSAEFDSLMSPAPATPEVAEPEVAQPPTEDAAVEPPAPDAPVPPQDAPEPEEQVVETAPEVPPDTPEVAQAPQEATGAELVSPGAQIANEDRPGLTEPDQLALLRPKPRPAPRIDSTPAPKPEPDAAPSRDQTESTEQSDEPVEQTEKTEETAPQESTTEIVPDPDPDSAAPVRSARPRGRPSDIVQRAARAAQEAEARKQAEAEAAEAARKEAEAKAIEDALKAATSQPAAPTGPPLTGSEKGALVLAVQQCWNVPVGVQDAGDLVVTLAVTLSPDGRVEGNPVLIEPSGNVSGLTRQAYEAGRRALLRCQPYDLPREKYEQWKRLEVVFNPQKMVLR